MKLAPAMAVLIVVLVATAMSGCFDSPHKITNTVAPPTPVPTDEPEFTATPRPSPVAVTPTVTASGDATTIKGSMYGIASGFHVGQGVFIISWSGSGTQFDFSLTDPNSNTISDVTKGTMSGSRLMIVDENSLYAGDFSLAASSDNAWSVTISRAETSSASSLPVTVSGGDNAVVVSSPFNAKKGNIKIGYSFSQTATGSGYVSIYDVLTGSSFYVRPMTSGSQIGQSNAEVPANGIYIAQITIPPGASFGEITLSQ